MLAVRWLLWWIGFSRWTVFFCFVFEDDRAVASKCYWRQLTLYRICYVPANWRYWNLMIKTDSWLRCSQLGSALNNSTTFVSIELSISALSVKNSSNQIEWLFIWSKNLFSEIVEKLHQIFDPQNETWNIVFYNISFHFCELKHQNDDNNDIWSRKLRRALLDSNVL